MQALCGTFNSVPGSGHVACTVEMASLGMHADVAVIYEIHVNNMLCCYFAVVAYSGAGMHAVCGTSSPCAS
jgi:hypothetical protein